MYDIIGDVHGYAEPLKELLKKLRYNKSGGVWQHPTRRVIFVGDYIDRGPAIRETLQIVKSMVDTGNAIALMGNHEFNALGYHTPDGKGDYLRKHSEPKTKQHFETLKQFSAYSGEWELYLKWFYQLPLFIELPGMRAVHACWDEEDIQWLKENNYSTMNEQLLLQAHERSTKPFKIIEDILKGKEVDVPVEWFDKDGNPRMRNRIKWWKDPVSERITNKELLFNCPDQLKDEFADDKFQIIVYPREAPPVFVGHYWLEDELPVVQSHNVACLDYSIAKKGKLVAYRWDGEQELNSIKLVSVG